uniref:Putative DNA helicase n=1 Tax=uncultured Thiotrichaceae bacterium TaxID=298394 RepID=A0A6S6TVA3_9GAMM|nr:MAG: putative DNA helicase [uncultured Thiotrichaceae bacterium]
MANMDEITCLDRSIRRHFKKVLSQLSNQFFIRTPIFEKLKIAPLIIEGPQNTWLLLGWHKNHPAVDELSRFIDFNNALVSEKLRAIKYMAVVDATLPDFEAGKVLPAEVIVVEKRKFYSEGHEYLLNYLSEVSDVQHSRMKRTLFAETVIHTQCTTRRKTQHCDNSAALQRFFLDYDQELATRFDMLGDSEATNGLHEDFSVRLINGVAGSGKTLILINRALLFCKTHPDKKVLLIIHNKPVTSDIEYRINEWLGGKPDNLTVQTFHSFALKQKYRTSGSVKPLFSDKDLQKYKTTIFNDDNAYYEKLTLSDAQLWGEVEYINEHLIQDRDTYLAYERHGRGFALQKTQRAFVWMLYEQFMAAMSSVQAYLPSLYIRELALLESTEALIKYDHILVDEAQFFAPSWLQLVKQSLCSGGSIFICADPNQGFLKSRLSWKSVGFNVRGRTKKLSYSYRTTYEIMLAANTLLEFMDENSDDFIKPDLARMERGSQPQVIYSSSTQDEQQRFLNELKQCVVKDDLPLQQIMVLCSESYNPWTLKPLIERELGTETVVNCNDAKDLQHLGHKIRLMNINSCTGMESGVTFVLGIGSLMNQAKNLELGDDEREISYQESIRKLYVSMTRAGQKLVLFSTEKLPESIDDLVEATNIPGKQC